MCGVLLQVPIADGGALLTSDHYIRELVRIANEKMHRNWERMQTLTDCFRKNMLSPAPSPPQTPSETSPGGPVLQFSTPPAALAVAKTGSCSQPWIGTPVADPQGEAGEGVAASGGARVLVSDNRQNVVGKPFLVGVGGMDNLEVRGTVGDPGDSVPAVLVRRRRGKAVKDALKGLGWLHGTARVSKGTGGLDRIALPLYVTGSAGVRDLLRYPTPAAPASDAVPNGWSSADATCEGPCESPAGERLPISGDTAAKAVPPDSPAGGTGFGPGSPGEPGRNMSSGAVSAPSSPYPLSSPETRAGTKVYSLEGGDPVQEIVRALADGGSLESVSVERLPKKRAPPRQMLQQVVADLLNAHGG